MDNLKTNNCDEKIEVYGGSNRLCAEAVRDWNSGGGGLPEDGYFPGYLFQLECAREGCLLNVPIARYQTGVLYMSVITSLSVRETNTRECSMLGKPKVS